MCRDWGDDCCANNNEGEPAACADGYMPNTQPYSWDSCPNYSCCPTCGEEVCPACGAIDEALHKGGDCQRYQELLARGKAEKREARSPGSMCGKFLCDPRRGSDRDMRGGSTVCVAASRVCGATAARAALEGQHEARSLAAQLLAQFLWTA